MSDEAINAMESDGVRFYWCHTEGCPDNGRARRRRPADSDCEFCGEARKVAAPSEDWRVD